MNKIPRIFRRTIISFSEFSSANFIANLVSVYWAAEELAQAITTFHTPFPMYMFKEWEENWFLFER
jgi:hypothetical protein